MICEKCGSKISDTALFCSNCGERTKNDFNIKYDVINYDEKYAKSNKTTPSLTPLTIRGSLYVILPIFLIFFGVPYVIALGLSLCGIAVFVTECLLRRKYIISRESAIVVEKGNNKVYYVTLFVKSLNSDRFMQNYEWMSKQAQNDNLVIQEIERYKAGLNNYNNITGGNGIRVIFLKNRSIEKETNSFIKLKYENEKGELKKIKIPKSFPGMMEVI